MMIQNNKNIYEEKICKFCKNYLTCDQQSIRENKYYNGIINKRCSNYEYNKIEVS